MKTIRSLILDLIVLALVVGLVVTIGLHGLWRDFLHLSKDVYHWVRNITPHVKGPIAHARQ